MNTKNHQIRIIIYIIIGAVIAAAGVFLVLHSNNTKSGISLQDKLDLGHKYLVELSYDKAVLEFTDAIEIDPMNVDAYIGLADAYIGQGDTDKAVEVLEDGFDKTGDDRIKEKLDELKPVENTSDETSAGSASTEVTSVDNEKFITIRGEQYSTSLTELYLRNLNLTDEEMALLSEFKNLETLDLYNVSKSDTVTDISALSDLKNLTTLNLSGNNVVDISALSNLKNLTKLNLFFTSITDISPLSDLTNLKELLLTVDHNDLNSLSNLVNLTSLALIFSSNSDISPLSNLKNLEHMSLHYVESIDLHPLSNMTSLTSLYIECNGKPDLNIFSNLVNLTRLTIYNRDGDYYDTSYYDISPLSNLKKLRELTLNAIDAKIELSPLSDLTELEQLDLGFNKIDDISPLENLTNLEFLNLAGNQISDISPLSNLTNMRILHLSHNPISEDEINELKEKLPNLY